MSSYSGLGGGMMGQLLGGGYAQPGQATPPTPQPWQRRGLMGSDIQPGTRGLMGSDIQPGTRGLMGSDIQPPAYGQPSNGGMFGGMAASAFGSPAASQPTAGQYGGQMAGMGAALMGGQVASGQTAAPMGGALGGGYGATPSPETSANQASMLAAQQAAIGGGPQLPQEAAALAAQQRALSGQQPAAGPYGQPGGGLGAMGGIGNTWKRGLQGSDIVPGTRGFMRSDRGPVGMTGEQAAMAMRGNGAPPGLSERGMDNRARFEAMRRARGY